MQIIFDNLFKLGLAPVLIPQAMRLRRSALSLPEAGGPRVGRAGQGRRLRVLLLGDSSIAGVGADTQDRAIAGCLARALGRLVDVEWVVEGRTGDTTAQALARLQGLERQHFDIAITGLGVNDITKGVPEWRWCQRQRAIWNLLQQDFGVQRIYVSGVPPMGFLPLLPQPMRWILGRQSTRYDRALRRMIAARPECRHVPLDFPNNPRFMAEDGFHPGPVVYRAWANRIAALVRTDLAYGLQVTPPRGETVLEAKTKPALG